MLNTSLRKTLSWALFTLSCLSFLLVFLVPFLNLTNTEKVATAGGLYFFCQITWWLSKHLEAGKAGVESILKQTFETAVKLKWALDEKARAIGMTKAEFFTT